jgi:NitT/TauT family transport system substrate-binding protein
MSLTRRATLGALSSLAAPAILGAQPLRRVVFGTNWIAQPEHGGFYQALADGTYARHGLEVVIRPGGPQVNNRILLPVGQIDFFMGGNLIPGFLAVEQNIPTMIVAAMFQKEPQAILTHPGQGLDTWDSLKAIDLLIAPVGLASFFRWMEAEHGFRRERVRPYTFNSGPFCANPRVGQQGYVTAEPFGIRRNCGFDPVAHLLSDHGFDTYATTIEARRQMVEQEPDVVRRFVDASILGWASYLDGDARAGDALIRRDNPDMSAEQIAFSHEALRRYSVLRSPDTERLGLGAMTDARVRGFAARMVRSGIVRADTDISRAYTLDFVNKGLAR